MGDFQNGPSPREHPGTASKVSPSSVQYYSYMSPRGIKATVEERPGCKA